MAMQTGGGTARDRIMARARAMDDEEKKKQQAQQPQQTRQSARVQVPMRYRQTAQEPGQEAAQQPQTTARDRIQARARAMGQQRAMSGLGDLTVEEYQYALKQAEAASPKRDENPGFFSRVGKWLVGKTEKTPEEIVAEQWDALEAARKREELASLDLDEYEKLLEQAKKQAADARPDFNIHAMGAYDAAAENTQAQRKADEMQQTYNLARQVQFERQGEQALAQLTPKQLEAVETLVKTPATGTSVMSAGVARENARDQAYSVLLEGGYSYKTISDLVTWRSRQQDKEAYQKTVQWHEDLADSGVLGGAAATVLSVPENLLSGVGAIDVALQKANQTGGEERPVNYYSAPMRLYGGANAARETVGQKLERNTDATIFGQNVASAAYGIGTSMLDSGATVALAAIGVPPVVGSSLLGGAAATGAMVDAKDRGVDDTHALWTGVFAGVAETLFEDVSLERLLKLDVPQGTLRQRMQTTLKNTLLQAGTEGSEELFTDFANYITDRAINGGLSEYDTAVRAYIDQGLSQKEASQKAGADLAAQMALDFVAGGVAGGLMAGGKAAIDNAGQDREMRQYSDLAPAAAEERLAADPGSRAARRVQKQVQQGKPVSGAALRETMAQNVEAQNQAVTEQVRKLAQQRLEELGDTQAEKTSRAVAQLYDQELPQYRLELARKALRSSEYGQRVVNEMEDAVETGRVRTLLEQAGETEDATRVPRWTSGEWAENLPRYTSQGAYINQLMERRVNPSATDKRPVTGVRYNQETGQLDAIVKGEDGKAETIPKERAATTGRQEWLADLAADLKEAAPTMIASYMDGQDVQTFSRQWHNAYEYGAAGVKKDYAMNSQAVDQLNATQRELAYDAGAAARAVQQTQERMKFPQEGQDTGMTREGAVSLKGATVGGVTYAPVTQETMTRRQRDSVEVMRQLARVSGVDVVFYQSRANEKGEYTAANGFYRDGTVYLDINAGKNRVGDMSETAVLLTASHELTHFIQEYSPAQYEQLRDFVVERLTESQDTDLDTLVERHRRAQPELSYDQALDEVVADGCQMMLKDSQAAAALAKQNRNLAGNIRSWLRKWVKRLQEAFRGLTARSREAQALTWYAKEVQKIWDDALVGAARNLQQSEAETASGEKAASTRGKASARDGGIKTSDGAIVWDDSLIHDTTGDDGVWGDNLHQQSGPAAGESAAEVRYEVRRLDGQTMVVLDTQPDTRSHKAAAAYLKALVNAEKPFSTILADALPVYAGKDLPSEYKGSEYTLGMHRGLREVKMQAATNLDEMLLLAEDGEWRENVKEKHGKDAQNGWYRYKTRFAVPVLNARKAVDHYAVYGGVLLIRNDADGKSYLYDMVDVEKKKVISSPPFSAQAHSGVYEPKPSESIIRPGNEKSNTKFSVRDNTGRELTPAQQEYFRDSKARDENGNLLVMYHQTDGDFTVFDTEHKGAGTGDDETPFGVFLKKTSRDIGVRGKKQMQLYANIQNPLRVDNREQLVQSLARMSEEYASLKAESGNIDKEYGAKFEKAKRAFVDFLTRWRKENPDAPARAAYNAEGFDAAFNAEDEVVKEWTKKQDALALKAKKAATAALRENGYDGVFLEKDQGSWGRSTEAYIALDANQVKNVDNQNPTTDPDIRFSVRERFPDELDRWEKDGMPEGVEFTLGSTGPVLQGLGAIESDIYMSGDKIRAILDPDAQHPHPEMTAAEIKKIPQILEDPVLVLKSRGRGTRGENSRLAVFGLIKAKNGQPVMAVMDLRPREGGFLVDDMQKVNSAYTKDNAADFIQRSDVLFADKKRTIPLLRMTGLTIASQQLLRNGYVGSIAYSGQRVKIEGVPFSSVVQEGDTRFSVREAKITDRELLANALETTARNAEERRILKWYREVAKSLTEHEQLLENMRQQLADHKSGEKALSPGKVKDLEDYTEYIVNKLDEEDRKLLKIESMGPMRKLLEREREYVERRLAGAREEKDRYRADFEQRLQEARRREQESLIQYRERREESERRRAVTAKIERTTRQLADRLNTNTDKKHIPEPLKKPVAQLLTALDYSSRSSLRGDRATRADQEYCRAMEGIRRVLADQEAFQQGAEGSEDALGGYLDLPPGLTDLMTKHIQTVENIIEDRMPTETVLRRMNLTQLRDLDVILSTVTRAVTKMNELLENRTFVRVADAAEDTMAELHRRGQYKGAAEKAETFVAWDNTLPWYAFQRFGEGGRAIFGELQDGWDKLAFNSKQVLDFRKSVITDEQARAWDTEVRQVELLDQEGETVTVSMTTAQLMGLYCLSKRKQALGHLFGGGIRITDIETRGKLRKKTIKQDEHYKMDDQMLGRLLGQLTPEQIAVADKLQKYMTEQGSKWGNEVTMKRFGYRGFTEKIYYPIETDSQDRLSQAGDGTEGSLYRLQNISAVKPLVQNANNAIMLRGIFDVFSNHMADMAKYNALVIPIVDAQKWYNYKDSAKNETGQVNTRTVQRAMTKAYGQSANRYVVQFLKDLNGVKESGARGEAFADKMISNYKRAAVAANLRVALLQPTAYVRAAAVLDYKYLAKAFGDRTGTRQATAEMLEHSGIALWKDMGFFDTDVGRSIRDQIKGKGSKLEDLVDKSMAAAELGDKVTWARLWRACKLEAQEKQGLSGDELIKATARRFRDVIYQTQVIDSTMTRSHMMRSSSTFSKMFTSFMSEPTVSYNLIMEGTRQILKDKKAMGLKTAIGRNWKTAGRAYQAYVVSALAAAVVESLADALRDDDDDTLWEKLWNAFGGPHGNLASDLNPLNKLPYMRDVFSALDGYDNGRMDTEGLANAKKAYDILMESYRLATGQQDKATSTTYYGNMTTYGKVYQTFRAVSMLSGLPLSAATREVITTWNNTVGSVWPGMKRKTYESKKLREAYNSYAKPAGISYDTLSTAMEYVATLESDKDAEGKTVSGSLKAKYVAYIQSMGLTPSQQKAMWLALKNSTWSDKGTPWE